MKKGERTPFLSTPEGGWSSEIEVENRFERLSSDTRTSML